MPSNTVRPPEIIVHNASAPNLDKKTQSELEAYEDEADNLLGNAIGDADYDPDREYYAAEEESDEGEESEETEESDGGYLNPPLTESNQEKGRCH